MLEMLRKRPRPAAEATRAASGISRAAVGTSRATLPHGDFRLLSVAPSPCLDTRAPPPTTGRPAAPGARVSSRARPRASPRRACRAWTTRGVSILWTPPRAPTAASARPCPARRGTRRTSPWTSGISPSAARSRSSSRNNSPRWRASASAWASTSTTPRLARTATTSPHLRKLPHDSDFIGPESFPRRQRDWIGYYIFFALCFASFVIGTNGVTEAEPAQLWRLADYRGRLCGVDEGVAGKPYLWHPHADHRGVDEGGDVGVCVRRCPLAHQWVCVPADANVTDPNAHAHVPRARGEEVFRCRRMRRRRERRWKGSAAAAAARVSKSGRRRRRRRRRRGWDRSRSGIGAPDAPAGVTRVAFFRRSLRRLCRLSLRRRLLPRPPRPLRRPPRRRTRARAARGTTPC